MKKVIGYGWKYRCESLKTTMGYYLDYTLLNKTRKAALRDMRNRNESIAKRQIFKVVIEVENKNVD